MEPIVSSETSAIRIQMPGNYPKRNKLHGINLFEHVGLTADPVQEPHICCDMLHRRTEQ